MFVAVGGAPAAAAPYRAAVTHIQPSPSLLPSTNQMNLNWLGYFNWIQLIETTITIYNYFIALTCVKSFIKCVSLMTKRLGSYKHDKK